MVTLNRDFIKDKLHACWVGKNIGGTMGTPFEASRDILDINGFNSPKGEPLPNDDLDLQLVWLKAMEEVGPYDLTSAKLADYWAAYVTPWWNEYGVGKSNFRCGLVPPMTGEYNNDFWKNSNGAWIRSEIWACLAPGFPKIACRYAFMDASVDHGFGEGTYAEIFTAAIQSMAFFESDIRKLINEALTYIPEDCQVAKSIKFVIENYDKKADWKDTRNEVIELNKDLGWFQAPSNIAFVVIGLLYGEGDFKRSMILAINCGDDTDCTGATVGAFLGILYGSKGIPKDWEEYIGDKIITVCIAGGSHIIPRTCQALTDRVYNMITTVMRANGVICEFTDGENNIRYDIEIARGQYGVHDSVYWRGATNPITYFDRKPYSMDGFNEVHTYAYIEYEDKPEVKANDEIKLNLILKNQINPQHYAHIKLYLPEGWTAEYDKNIFVDSVYRDYHKTPIGEITIHSNENVSSINRGVIEVTVDGHATVGLIPITLIGK